MREIILLSDISKSMYLEIAVIESMHTHTQKN